MKKAFFLSLLLTFGVISMMGQMTDVQCREANLQKNNHEYLTAIKMYQQHREEGIKGRHLLDVLFSQAECYYMLDNYEELENCIEVYEKEIESCIKELGDSIDIYTAYIYKMAGNYYYGQTKGKSGEDRKRYNYSLEYYNESLKICEERGMEESANSIRQNIAQLHYKVGEYQKAREMLTQSLEYYQQRIDNDILSDMPNYYQTMANLAMCNARLGNEEQQDDQASSLFDESLSQIDKAIEYKKKAKDDIYYEWMRRKGKILMMQHDRLGIQNYKVAKACYEQYINYQRATIDNKLDDMTDSQRRQNWLSMHEFLFDCYRLGDISSEMLYDLALFSKGYLLTDKKQREVTWKQVKKALGKDDCAIEFVQYYGEKDKLRLGCLVLRKDSKRPQFIDIAATDSILQKRISRRYSVEDAITSTKGDNKDMLYTDTLFWHDIWIPALMNAIGNSKKVYFSPDGFLNLLAIEYMMPDESKDCYRLTSTRILTQERSPLNTAKMLSIGGMIYDAKIHPTMPDNDKIAYNLYKSSDASLNYLEYAKEEVDSIYALRHNPQDVLITGKGATDESFVNQLDGKFPIVHLSTHGGFGGHLEAGTDLKPAMDDNSLSLSTLCFAGVTTTLSDPNFNDELFDGLLTASEISRLDMEDVEFIALSACQTGLGYITADGVYGLQRGLKQAGVKSMMATLWSVNDYSCFLFFKNFYQALESQETKSLHEALKTARKKLLEGKDCNWCDTPRHTHPYILIDAF